MITIRENNQDDQVPALMNIAELEPEQVKPDLCNALYWSLMVVLLLMIIGQFMSFQEKPMPIYGGYELLESRYWKNFKSIGNKPVVYQTTANYFTSNNHLEVYLQHTKEQKKHFRNYPECIRNYDHNCCRDRLRTYGVMIAELQSWLIDNIKGNEKILVQFRQDLTLMIILLARTLTTGITLTVFVKPDASQQKLTALKLSLVNNQYYSLVRFVSEVITNQFDFVISSNAFFEQFMANRVKSSPLIDSENYEAEYSSLYPSTRVIVVIDTPLKAVEKQRFAALQRKILRIQYKSKQINYEQLPMTKAQLDQISGFSIFLISSGNEKQRTDTISLSDSRSITDIEIHPSPCPLASYSRLADLTAFPKHILHNTRQGLTLVVPIKYSKEYMSTGCLNPELLALAHEIVHKSSRILVFPQIYEDDLMYLVMALLLDSGFVYLNISNPMKKQVLSFNAAKLNVLDKLITIYSSSTRPEGIVSLLAEENITILFITLEYLQINEIAIVAEQRTVIFSYSGNKPTQEKYISQKVGHWLIYQLRPINRMQVEELCLDYKLQPVRQGQEWDHKWSGWMVAVIPKIK